MFEFTFFCYGPNASNAGFRVTLKSRNEEEAVKKLKENFIVFSFRLEEVKEIN